MRIALGVEYDGTAFVGWQRQRQGRSVQQTVEEALSKVANTAITVICAGRTDAGVHARGQVVHFDSDVVRQQRSWLLGSNTSLPDDVSVNWVRQVADEFHARYSAVSRTYHYKIFNRATRSALHHNRSYWIHEPLDEQRMQAAAQHLLGEHDFSSFRAAGCQSRTSSRTVHHLSVTRAGDCITIEITANAFLQHMVRNIVGLLVVIGRGEQEPGWAAGILAAKDRRVAPFAAPAAGLYLQHVAYPVDLLPAEIRE